MIRMIFLTIVIAALMIATATRAVIVPGWSWGALASGPAIAGNPEHARAVVAATGSEGLWCRLVNIREISVPQLGDYQISRYDTSGNLLAAIVVEGKVSVISAHADSLGNWYILAFYKDTLQFPGGLAVPHPPGGSDYCLFRLDGTTLALQWLQQVGGNFFAGTNCFAAGTNGLYVPVDSSGSTRICLFDFQTGSRKTLWQQTGQAWTTSIAVDKKGSVYLTGTCVAGHIDFNGHTVNPPPLMQYPQYMVRYRADGSHHWSKLMEDGTCFTREFHVADDNTIYYTGPLHGVLTLGALTLHAPAAFRSFMAAQLDSSGSFSWARQLTDTASGTADLTEQQHAAALPDGTLVIYTATRGYADWADGVITVAPQGRYHGTVVAFSRQGATLWARAINATYVVPQQLAAGGNNVWVTGNAADSAALQLGDHTFAMPPGPLAYYAFIGRLGHAGPLELPQPLETAVVQVFPNPAKGYIRLRNLRPSSGSYFLTLRNAAGNIVLREKTDLSEGLKVDHIPRGIYLLEIQEGANRSLHRILLQ